MRSFLCTADIEALRDSVTKLTASSYRASLSSSSPAPELFIAPMSKSSTLCVIESMYTGLPRCFQSATTRCTSSSLTKAPCTRVGIPPPGGRNSMSPLPNSCSAPPSPSIVLESTFDCTINDIRVGILALISPVNTSTDGLCVARIKCIPAALAF